jgi:hypothetical protein
MVGLLLPGGISLPDSFFIDKAHSKNPSVPGRRIEVQQNMGRQVVLMKEKSVA